MGKRRALLLGAALGAALVACGSPTSQSTSTAKGADAGLVADVYTPGIAKKTANGNFTIALWSQPAPPAMGMNSFTLQITDASGAPVTGAWVKVLPTMPQHGHGSNEAPAVLETKAGTFQCDLVDLQMMGVWQIMVQVNTIDTTDATNFYFDVQ